MESYKNKRPIVPLEERAEIVRSIKYVDEVIITNTLDKKKSGIRSVSMKFISEMTGRENERWERTGKKMEALGARLVYLPSTKRYFFYNAS